MNKAKILDCTLRDGAYLVDKQFGESTIYGIINGLMKAKIDYIEIGFLQNEGFAPGKTVFKDSKDAKQYIPEDKQGCEIAVMADYSRYSIEHLDANKGDSFDIVRECFFKHERHGALEVCKLIKEKGYKVFVQPVDVLGYTDKELLELVQLVNQIEPYCLSIVDTFGSMYEEDLQHVYSLIDHNLIESCKIGFHSHNNMQMSNALSQAFIRMSQNGKREVIIDGTISGMGRGAGNTPTELIAEYMVSKLGYNYKMDELLDVIDGYMDSIRARCTWGYTTPYFLAGAYSAHVNNITYLTQKSSIRSKDIRYILNKIGVKARKRYEYDLLENTYIDYMQAHIDDESAINSLKEIFSNKNVVVIAPGKTIVEYHNSICKYVDENNAVVITVNFVHDTIESDFVYMSNARRYQYWLQDKKFLESKKILTSNIILEEMDSLSHIVSFAKLVKCGWEHLDNSTILLLRLLDKLEVADIAIAGLDGYNHNLNGELNYATQYLELANVKDNPIELNREIQEMLIDFIGEKNKAMRVKFITPSRFESVLEK